MKNDELSHVLALEFVKNTIDFSNISPIEFLTKYAEANDQIYAKLKEESDNLASERLNKFIGTWLFISKIINCTI